MTTSQGPDTATTTNDAVTKSNNDPTVAPAAVKSSTGENPGFGIGGV
jgi:hypothetical protein